MPLYLPTMGRQEQMLSELILYVSDKCESDPNFGSIKLNKILYFSDFLSVGMRGRPITGVKYQHLDKGPAPNALIPFRNRMVERGDLKVETRLTVFGYEQIRTIPLRPAKESLFEKWELDLVNQVIQSLSKSTGTEASDISHREVGWLTTKMKEEIPYASIFLSDEPLSTNEIDYAQEEWIKMMDGSENEAGKPLGL